MPVTPAEVTCDSDSVYSQPKPRARVTLTCFSEILGEESSVQ